MTSYNVKSSFDNGWSPAWFKVDSFGSELVEAIEKFQKENGLKPDGFCGPQTFEILKSKRPKENMIICGSKHYAIPHKVILWNDKEKGLKADKGSYRTSYYERNVDLFVNHWDVCRKSSDCINVLNNKGLSAQFLIDSDGTIYQTMNCNHIAFHAGGRSWNNASVGVEINNPYYTKYQNKKNPRPIVRNAKVHGNTMSEHLGFYPVQLDALKKLWKVMAIAYGIPFQTPTKENGEELARVHNKSINLKYRGFVHHYNLTSGKIDCGGLDLTKLIHDIKWT